MKGFLLSLLCMTIEELALSTGQGMANYQLLRCKDFSVAFNFPMVETLNAHRQYFIMVMVMV